VFASARQLARTLGPGTAACYALARLLDIATRGRLRVISYRFVAQPVPRDGGSAPTRTGAIELRHLHADDPLVAQLPRPPSVIARRFRDGAHCLAAIRGGRLVGFLWFKEREYFEDEVRCIYRFDAETAVWDFDVYIDPEFRLGRLFARLWDFANRELQARGYRWTLSRISAFNPASLAAHARLGARRLGSALFFVAGPVQVSFASCAPYVHIGWRDDMRPVFTLDLQ
jgi:GNAT superfamily N-acetyltransferase